MPYYEQRPDPAEMTREVYDILMAYNRIPIDDLNHPPYNYPLPDGTVQFNVSTTAFLFFIFFSFVFNFFTSCICIYMYILKLICIVECKLGRHGLRHGSE